MSAQIILKRKRGLRRGNYDVVMKHKYCIDREQLEADEKGIPYSIENHTGQSVSMINELLSKDEQKRLFLSPRSAFKRRWDYFIMLIVTYNCIVIPIEICFEPEALTSPVANAVTALTDIIFLLDMIVIFRTAVYEEMLEVYDKKIIARQYLKGRFTIDLLSTLPFDLMIGVFVRDEIARKFKVMAALKMIRLNRLAHIISSMAVTRFVKIRLQLAKMIFFLLIYVHATGCFWFLVVKQDEQWLPPLTVLAPGSPDLFEASFLWQYWVCWYTSMLLLLGNDIYPTSEFSIIIGSLFGTAGAFIMGNTFGILSELAYSMVEDAIFLQSKVDLSNSACVHASMPYSISNNCLAHIRSVHSIQREIDEAHNFLKTLSPKLSNRVVFYLVKELTSVSGLLGEHSDIEKGKWAIEIEKMSRILTLNEIEADKMIFREGDDCNGIFFLFGGRINAFQMVTGFRQDVRIDLNRGDAFGEVSFFLNCERTLTLISRSVCSLLHLDIKYKDKLQDNSPSLMRLIKEQIFQYNDEAIKLKLKELRNIPWLSEVEDKCIQELAFQLKKEEFLEGQRIATQMELVDRFYIIMYGVIELTLQCGSEEFVLEVLGRGSLINHRICLLSRQQNKFFRFNVVAKSAVQVMYLMSDTLKMTKSRYPKMEQAIDKQRKLLQKLIPECDFYKESQDHLHLRPRTKYAMILLRTVKRQMIINAYKKKQAVEFVLRDDMGLTDNQLDKIPTYLASSSYYSIKLARLVINRLNDKHVLTGIEGIEVNNYRGRQVTNSIMQRCFQQLDEFKKGKESIAKTINTLIEHGFTDEQGIADSEARMNQYETIRNDIDIKYEKHDNLYDNLIKPQEQTTLQKVQQLYNLYQDQRKQQAKGQMAVKSTIKDLVEERNKQQNMLMEHYLQSRGDNLSNRKDYNVPRLKQVIEMAIKHHKEQKQKAKWEEMKDPAPRRKRRPLKRLQSENVLKVHNQFSS